MGTRTWKWGEGVAELLATLRRGGVLVIPTESSYALAVDPRNRQGVDEVYRLKGRERGNPLPVVAGDLGQLADLGVSVDTPELVGVAAHWPAPLTLVVPTRLSLPASAGTGSLAVRIPDHPRLRALLETLGTGLTATSANRSGEDPITDPAKVVELVADCDAVVIDDGPLPGGLPSTVVTWQNRRLRILRPGAYPADRLRGAGARRPDKTSPVSTDAAEILVEKRR